MKPRTIEEIEKAFHEMGLTETTWGKLQATETKIITKDEQIEQTFIRIETTTTPLEVENNADLA